LTFLSDLAQVIKGTIIFLRTFNSLFGTSPWCWFPNEVPCPFLQLIDEREGLAAAVIEREQDVEEHALVIKNLEGQDASKKAWRLVGDVMVERTVGEVLPDIMKNRDNLVAVAGNFRKQLESKQKEVLEFQEKYNIRLKNQGDETVSSDSNKAASSGQGVLVA